MPENILAVALVSQGFPQRLVPTALYILSPAPLSSTGVWDVYAKVFCLCRLRGQTARGGSTVGM